MKISEITNEMTMRGPDLSLQAEQYARYHESTWKQHGKHIGDIEQYNVLKYENQYSVWHNDQIVACATLSEDNVVDKVWVSKNYQGLKIFSMLLWFFKTRLNRSPLTIGNVHSKMMQEVVKGLSRFEKYWRNIHTDQKEPFSVETLDNFYSYLKPTEWVLILENNGDFSDWPMFNTNSDFIREPYEPYVE
jgi:hypothetical protein